MTTITTNVRATGTEAIVVGSAALIVSSHTARNACAKIPNTKFRVAQVHRHVDMQSIEVTEGVTTRTTIVGATGTEAIAVDLLKFYISSHTASNACA